MWQDLSRITVDDLIKRSVMSHLKIEGQWIGNPKDSTFGIVLTLTWDNNPFSSTIINFFDENSNKNL